MDGEQSGQEAARTELRILQKGAGVPVPSADAGTAAAEALRTDVQPLLDLRLAAVEGTNPPPGQEGPGKPITQWDPHDLEVHRAVSVESRHAPGTVTTWPLSSYVERNHDRNLAKAVTAAAQGSSRLVVLVGTSSTGKTRACWEAVQPLATQGWRLWHPFDPTRPDAALADLHQVRPRTVIWLNEAQHYLGDPRLGEHIAAALHSLLIEPRRGPVLILGTLWPHYVDRYTALPPPGDPDPYSRVRELLVGRTLNVPDAFSKSELCRADALARGGDRLLSETLIRAGIDGRVTQDLAGAYELVRRYEHSRGAARAVLDAAMDARILGVGLHIPQAFLIDAATGYLSDLDLDRLTEDWAEAAFADLARPVHGGDAPLRRRGNYSQQRPPSSPVHASARPRATGPTFRLADYLEQYGRNTRRTLCPPASFWHAADAHLAAEELNTLAAAAESRHRLQWADHLRRRAADSGSLAALATLAREGGRDCDDALARRLADGGYASDLLSMASKRERAGDVDGAERFYHLAGDAGSSLALVMCARQRDLGGDTEVAEVLARRAADAGDCSALITMAIRREHAGMLDRAEHLYGLAVNAGHSGALVALARMREQAGAPHRAEVLALRAADAGNHGALIALTRSRADAGNWDGVDALARRTADAGHLDTLVVLAEERKQRGHLSRAEHLYQLAANAGHSGALVALAHMREQAGDLDGAEAMARLAADTDNMTALVSFVRSRADSGKLDSAESLVLRAVDTGSVRSLLDRARSGNEDAAHALLRRVTKPGYWGLWALLAKLHEQAGDPERAEALARRLAEMGRFDALAALGRIRERAGDRDRAEALYGPVAEAGDRHARTFLVRRRAEAQDRQGLMTLARRWASAGDKGISALLRLAREREEAGDSDGAEALYQGFESAWPHWTTLVVVLERTGHPETAEALARGVANTDYCDALIALMEIREQARDPEASEALARRMADDGYARALIVLARMRDRPGHSDGAAALYQRAADLGDTDAMLVLAEMHERAGDPDGAEEWAGRAADHGNSDALVSLVRSRAKAGAMERVEALARRAANVGLTDLLLELAELRGHGGDKRGAETLLRLTANIGVSRPGFWSRWPYGLDPDGTPTPPWDCPQYLRRQPHFFIW